MMFCCFWTMMVVLLFTVLFTVVCAYPRAAPQQAIEVKAKRAWPAQSLTETSRLLLLTVSLASAIVRTSVPKACRAAGFHATCQASCCYGDVEAKWAALLT